MSSQTINELLARIRKLPADTPLAGALPLKPGHESLKAQWIGWLEEYLTSGYYERKNAVDDAQWAYQHLNNGRMVVWLNEAAGEEPRIIQAAIVAMAERESPPTEARYARLVLPWGCVAKLLFR
jgi:hypothetical protein